jgi:hypothetical protein
MLCNVLRLVRFDSFTYSLDHEINLDFKQKETMHETKANTSLLATPVTSALLRVFRSFQGILDPYSNGSRCYNLYKILGKRRMLPKVPNAPNPPNFDRISPCLFSDLHKTTNTRVYKMAKNTLRVSLVISNNLQNFLS